MEEPCNYLSYSFDAISSNIVLVSWFLIFLLLLPLIEQHSYSPVRRAESLTLRFMLTDPMVSGLNPPSAKLPLRVRTVAKHL